MQNRENGDWNMGIRSSNARRIAIEGRIHYIVGIIMLTQHWNVKLSVEYKALFTHIALHSFTPVLMIVPSTRRCIITIPT